MKRRKMIAIVLTLDALLCLFSFVPVALAQDGGRRLIASSSVIRLGPDQILRVTVNGQAGNDRLNVQFIRMYYVGNANGGIWKTSSVVQDTSGPIRLAEDEAASIDIRQTGFDAVRGEVIIRGYSGTTTVNDGVLFQIINASTGAVNCVWRDTDGSH
jgi:hypothetical protein